MIYKYMKSEFANSFFRDGTLRIGTLYEYRDTEKHGHVIGDNDEGLKSRHTEVKGKHTNKTAPAIVSQFVKLGDGAAVEDCVFIHQDDSGDCYLFCATEEYSADVMAEFKADTCLRIENVDGFYSAVGLAIANATGKELRFYGGQQCTYAQRHVTHAEDHGVPGALIKDPTYSNQKEIRAIWEPTDGSEIKPLIIKCPEARQFCTTYPKPIGSA